MKNPVHVNPQAEHHAEIEELGREIATAENQLESLLPVAAQADALKAQLAAAKKKLAALGA
jgi:hypothetical protein